MKQVIETNPEILVLPIKQNPHLFVDALSHSIRHTQAELERARELEEKRRLEAALNHQFKPLIRSDELIRGTKQAPLVLVQYSDFACPLSAQSFRTVQALLETYEGRIQVIVKHLPQKMHVNALISAKYYEALRIQSEELAVDFHDQLFSKQQNLRGGESFLINTARALGADMSRLANDIHSKEVERRILQDTEEAHTFGIQATPGFLLNGIPITGAYPEELFNALINKLEERHYVTF